MAARSHSGVQSAAQEARRILSLTEVRADWEEDAGRGPMPGLFPWAGGATRGRAAHDLAVKRLADVEDRPARPALARLAEAAGLAAQDRPHDVYDMLFQHLRDRAPGVVEIAAGTAEEGGLPPYGRVWAEYFPSARVAVLGPGPAPEGWPAEGPGWHWAGPERRKGFARGMRQALADGPAPLIAVDSGGQISLHQQNAFLELFPRLAPGGFYIIEGLRARPEAPEPPGGTRTAELFRGFAERRCFAHADAGTEASFAALGPQIAGVLMLQSGPDRADSVAVIHKR